MTFIPDTHEIAWAAGFFDGEGCTSYWEQGQRNKALPKSPGVGVSIPQVDPRPLLRFQKAVGGLGTIYGPYIHTSQVHQRSPIYQWRVGNWRGVNAVIGMLWKYLDQPKREQARLALTRYHAHPLAHRPSRRLRGKGAIA